MLQKEQSVAIGADTCHWLGERRYRRRRYTTRTRKTYGRLIVPNNFSPATASGTGSVATGSRTLPVGSYRWLWALSPLRKVMPPRLSVPLPKHRDELSTAIGFNALSTARSALALGSESSATSRECPRLSAAGQRRKIIFHCIRH